MFDVQNLKTRHDLRRIVESDLGPARGHSSKALLWRCPFHHEQNGYSLAVWADNWRCFGACSTGGDAIAWLQHYRGLTFQEACRFLGGELVTDRACPRSAQPTRPDNSLPPASEWQDAARKVVKQAVVNLWTPVGSRALAYLKERGLSRDTIWQARLGFVPGRYSQWNRMEGLNVPCGITIPWFIGDSLWAVKVRRAAGSPKYVQIAGGSAGGLYNAPSLAGQRLALFVEGEFDALLGQQESGGVCSVVTLGSASSPLSSVWLTDLIGCCVILVAYDADTAGHKGAARLKSLSRRVRTVQVPYGKDLTEFYLLGGHLERWLQEIAKTPIFEAEEG